MQGMANKEAVVVSCGASFTAVGTSENVVYFWGTRFISPYSTRPSTRDAFGQGGTRDREIEFVRAIADI